MLINKGNGGRLGNQMFGYAFGWLLAKRLGYAFENYSQRKGVKFSLEFFPNVKDLIDGKVITDTTEEVGDTIESFEEIVCRCMGKRVIVSGHFQRAEFYVPHRDDLKKLFFFPGRPDQMAGTIFHFRGTDFIGSQNEIPLDFYLRAWNKLGKPIDATVITDDLNYLAAKDFSRKTGALFQGGNIMQDFGLMMAAKTLVLSHSTFAWWAAFLSDANVIYPVSKRRDRNIFRNLSNRKWMLDYY